MLTREQIFADAPKKLPTREVEAFGGTVLVRTMSALEKDEWETFTAEQRVLHGRARNIRGEMLVRVCVKPDGSRLFDQDGDADRLAALPAGEVQDLMEASLKLNLLTRADLAALEGNSEGREAGDDSSSN
jgi:hypothetical protein